jgi:hypothetical protein
VAHTVPQPLPHATAQPAVTVAPQPVLQPSGQAAPAVTQVASLTCGRCGSDNDASRRLCRRCGNWLVVPGALPPAGRTSLRDARPWWLGGERTEYTGDLSRTTVLYRAAAGLVALLLVVGVLTVAGQHPVRRVEDLVGHQRGTGRVSGVTATSTEHQGDPAAAVDDVRALGWSPQWPSQVGGSADAGTVCDAPAGTVTGPIITLTLPRRIDVREIGVEAGLPAGDPQEAQRWRPKVLRLDWAGGGCQGVDLDDVRGLQRFGVHQDEPVTGVTVTVLSCYAPSPAAPAALDIGEITFWQR